LTASWRARLLSLFLVLPLLLGACSATGADRATEAARLADALTSAISSGDRVGFDEVFDSSVPAERLDEIWGNVIQFAQVRFTVSSEESWRVDWKVTDERSVAHNVVDAPLVCVRGSCLLGDLGQSSGRPTPVWLVEAITVQRVGRVTVVGGQAADAWLASSSAAMEAVASAEPSSLLRPSTTQVVEVPGSTDAFEQVMAATAFDFRGTGAVTWKLDGGVTEDTGEEDSAIHIVVNPDSTGDLTEDGRRVLLTHEGVHAATGWLGATVAGRTWVSEGLAEAIALPQAADEQERSLERLRAACPEPPGPPSDEAFTDPEQLDYAYAWSGWAVGRLLADDPSGAIVEALWRDSATVVPASVDASAACG